MYQKLSICNLLILLIMLIMYLNYADYVFQIMLIMYLNSADHVFTQVWSFWQVSNISIDNIYVPEA